MTAAVAACKPGSDVLRLTGQTMGTTYNVVAVDHGGAVKKEALQARIDTALAAVDTQMSNWNRGSEISRVNAAGTETLALSPALAEVMAGADRVHRASEGQFDVTAGALIELWGFGAGAEAPHIPSEAAIAEAMGRTGQSRLIALEGNSLRKSDAAAEIYLAAIGKGYGVDRLAEALRAEGLNDFMVEIGGDLYTSGRNADGSPWQIGIESPVPGTRDVYRVVGVSGQGMATSGDYRNFFESGGQRYSHIIDPTTGRPIVHDTVSATVITEDAMMADAWATAMLTLGRERGIEIAEAEGLAVFFVEGNEADGFTTTASRRFSAAQA